MSKIENAIETIRADLNNCFKEVDVEIGRIKREAREDESLVSGDTVENIAAVLMEYSGYLCDSIIKVRTDYRKKLWWGEGKFDEEYLEEAVTIYSNFKEYCLIMLEEASLVTGQKHLYNQHYPSMQKTLDSTLNNLSCLVLNNT